MIAYKSINQQNTSLEAREAYFQGLHVERGAVLLQTCNRVELYYGEGDVPDDVARHLFRVTAGLESALIGERAVQGQVKESYQQAQLQYRLTAEMHKLFSCALEVGKRVRTETEISQGAVSHSLAAIEILQQEQVDLSQSRITIVGVNKLTSDILKFLKNKGARMVFLANRSQMKALVILSLALIVVPVIVGLLTVPVGPSWRLMASRWYMWPCLGLALVVYIPLHELTHGIAMFILSGVRPTYGVKLPYAYAGSTVWFDKPSHIVTALAPVVVWGAALQIAITKLPQAWFWPLWIIQISNLSGSAGDLSRAITESMDEASRHFFNPRRVGGALSGNWKLLQQFLMTHAPRLLHGRTIYRFCGLQAGVEL